MNFKLMGALLGSLLFSAVSFAQVVKTDAAFIATGRRLYLSNCIQCHNRDPNIKGSIGPEMIDAPLDVMTAKVMTGKYPEKLPDGFVPKRKSKAMRAIPKLKNDIPKIWAFVQSVKKKK
jgi:mono/diheme cytochrome c family protein